MPMNKDGQNRMDGFLHAAADMDSARPDVQFYREHYGGLFGRSGASTSTSSQQAQGIALAGLVLGIFYAIGVASDYVNANWDWVAPVGGSALFLIAAGAANIFLPNFFRTAILLLFFIALTYAIAISTSAISNVYSGRFVSFQHYYADMYAQRLDELFGVAAIYAAATFVFCLTPWARRKRAVWKTILLANALLIGVPAIMIAIGSFVPATRF
jgi:hypothetical protein